MRRCDDGPRRRGLEIGVIPKCAPASERYGMYSSYHDENFGVA